MPMVDLMIENPIEEVEFLADKPEILTDIGSVITSANKRVRAISDKWGIKVSAKVIFRFEGGAAEIN